MPALAVHSPGRDCRNRDGFEIALPTCLLIGGCVNGFVARVVEDIGANGITSLTFGLSPFEIIVAAVASKLVLTGAPARRVGWGLADIVAFGLMLLPSSAMAWAGVALFAAMHAMRNDGDQRHGALLFLGLAVCALWSSIILKWLALPITTAEAVLVGQVAALFRPDIVQSSNVIGTPATHSLILMTACTTANGAPPAALALLAVGHVLGGIDGARVTYACGAMLAFYGAVNLVRLAIMTTSSDAYALMHGPLGSNGFDALQAGAVVILGSWASRS